MTLPRKPQKFYPSGSCSIRCSLHPRNLPIADQVHTWLENGDNNAAVLVKAQKLGFKLSNGAVGRHLSAHLLKEHQLLVGPGRWASG